MLDEGLKYQQAQLKKLVEASHNVVFFGGAGVSTESGIPDFRSSDGLYSQSFAHKELTNYRPEEILSTSFFRRHCAAFYDFYTDKMIIAAAKPNAAHRKLAKLEKAGILKVVITQNIDGLHQAAGSKNVIELHGSVLRNYCMDCHALYDVDFILAASGIPRCTRCGGIVKPDVILYEEPLNQNNMMRAVTAIHNADVLIVAGTSLVVYPAAMFLSYFEGSSLVIINRDPTPQDCNADLLITGNVGEVLDW